VDVLPKQCAWDALPRACAAHARTRTHAFERTARAPGTPACTRTQPPRVPHYRSLPHATVCAFRGMPFRAYAAVAAHMYQTVALRLRFLTTGMDACHTAAQASILHITCLPWHSRAAYVPCAAVAIPLSSIACCTGSGAARAAYWHPSGNRPGIAVGLEPATATHPYMPTRGCVPLHCAWRLLTCCPGSILPDAPATRERVGAAV